MKKSLFVFLMAVLFLTACAGTAMDPDVPPVIVEATEAPTPTGKPLEPPAGNFGGNVEGLEIEIWGEQNNGCMFMQTTDGFNLWINQLYPTRVVIEPNTEILSGTPVITLMLISNQTLVVINFTQAGMSMMCNTLVKNGSVENGVNVNIQDGYRLIFHQADGISNLYIKQGGVWYYIP